MEKNNFREGLKSQDISVELRKIDNQFEEKILRFSITNLEERI